MAIRGSCHCGKVAYRLDEEPPARAVECNCSICRRKGYVHHFTTPERFTLETSRDELATYRFNKQVIAHRFCRTCGCAPFCEGTGPNGPMVSVNLRCVEDLDLAAIEIARFDGAGL